MYACWPQIQRRLARTKVAFANPDAIDVDSDNEKPPSAARQRKQLAAMDREDGRAPFKRSRTSTSDGRRGSGGSGRARKVAVPKPKKLSKRDAARIIPPCYATVDIGMHEDREIYGTHPFTSFKDDVVAANKDVIRAVITKDYELLEKVTETPELVKQMSSFSAERSVDIEMTALKYAIQADDVKAVAQLLKVHAATPRPTFATVPSNSLPEHSTGAHTSSFSDYNRRAINASRGGKEGNNALLQDSSIAYGEEFDDEKNFFWANPSSSLKMLTLFYPSGDWVDNDDITDHVAAVARSGNITLLYKMVETLVRNDGWGFNNLHLCVLSSNDEALPKFRNVSIVKMSHGTKIQPLHFAALNPNGRYLKQLWETLEEKPENSKDKAGFEPLHYAAVCESSDNVKFLIENGRNLLGKTKNEKFTPLMCAIRAGREDNAIVMLDMTAKKSPELLTQVMNARGPASFQAIHFAARHGCLRVIERLLHHGALINALAGDKTSALCIATKFGQFESATMLLAHGAKVDLPDKLEKTPLIFAVKNGHTKLAALLINNGANVNAYDTSENSVAHYAASYGWLSCVELLASTGAEFWSRNSWGFVPLICALLKQRSQCADYILENDAHGRFLDFRDREGCTMLFLQCMHSKNLAQIEYLVAKGLNPNIPNANGNYPLDALIERAGNASDNAFCASAIEVLLKNGALAQYETPKDSVPVRQPLHCAIRGKQVKIAELLLKTGKVDPAVKESDGADAWLRAAGMGNSGEPFLRLLLAHYNEHFGGDKSPISFSSRVYTKNFFHVIAEYYYFTEPTEMIAVEVIRECIARCPNVQELMNEKHNELSPLLMLVSKERKALDTLFLSPEKAKIIKRVDAMYSEVVRLYATHTTDPEALTQYKLVTNPKFKEKVAVSVNSTTTTTGDVDMDDADEMEEEEPRYFTVKAQNILHIVCKRSLVSTPHSTLQKWYGEDILSIILEAFAFTQEEIDLVETDNYATPFLLAVRSRYLDGTKILLAKGANPDHSPFRCKECSSVQQPVSVSHCGLHHTLSNTALIYAINNNDRETAKLLLESSASPECFNGNAQLTPLHIVMANGDVEMTECLLKHHADPAKKDREGNTSLLRTIKENHSIPVKKPHEGEVSYTRKAPGLSVASSNTSTADFNKASIVEVVLAYDNVRKTLRMGDKAGRTALYFAAENRDLPLLRALVEAHPDKATCANTRDDFGRTPLHVAVNAVSMKADATFDVERFLLLAGADVNAVDNFNFSALHFALFKVNLDWHATYDARNSQTVTEQRRLGTYESVKEAASKKFFGQIPAAETDPVETVSNLVAARGVNLLLNDLLNRTPIHLAAATGAFVCASTLLSNLPSSTSRQHALEAKDANDFTPLACAFLHLRQTTITTLIQSNASVSDKLRLTHGVSSQSSKVCSFFYHAVKHSLAGIYHLLLNAKFSRRQAVEDAVLCGEFQLASNLIIGLEISNDSHSLGESNKELSETLMHCIARVDKPFDDLPRGVAWILMENGINLSHVNLKGNAAFHFAARNGNAHLMDFLLHHKCDVNLKNFAGETPLMYALRKEHRDVNKCMGLVDYFLNVPSFDLHGTDANGCNVLLLVLDIFIGSFQRTDSRLFQTVETLLKTGVKSDLLFQSRPHRWTNVYRSSPHVDTAGTAKGIAKPKTTTALLLITYVAPLIMRYELLELFLKHNTKLTTADENGNSVLIHLVAKNMKTEVNLILNSSGVLHQRLQKKEIRAAVAQQNRLGQTPLHIAVQALEYGAFENHDIVKLLVVNGADFHATNNAQQSVLECIKSQKSRALFRFIREQCPHVINESEEAFFDDAVAAGDDAEMTGAPPDFSNDAATYLENCDAAGKLEKTLVTPTVNQACDVGRVSSVYCGVDETTNEPIPGEFFNVLLTKVDVKNGRFGVNAFYRMQVVHDTLQEIYILFTNWGRIGEQGKYQNTPFRTAADAVVEFKKVFRSKTGNVWERRRDAFEKKVGKYNLVQRVDFHTEIAPEITEPFNDRVQLADSADPVDFAPLANTQQSLNLTQMLYAITDIRNLQLAAGQQCNYYGELPLAKKEELDVAITKLQEILVVLEARKQVDAEIQALTGNITDEATAQLQLLSVKFSDLTESISKKSSRYYEIMPVNERSSGSAIKAFEVSAQVNKELARLTLLAEITQTYKILLGAKLRQQEIHPLDYCRAALQVRISPLQANSQEKTLLTKFFFQGLHKDNHKRYVVSNIFRVDRHGEKERLADLLEREPKLKQKPTHLLWHGTKRTNLMGIIAQGLRIAPPEVSHHGYSYGKGLYFGDVAQKSLDYCDSAYDIKERGIDATTGKEIITHRRVHYMLLCEVALGESTLADSPTHDATTDGIDSVKAVGKHAPDMTQSVILPDCGAIVPIGRVDEPGVAYPINRAWAIGKCETDSRVNKSLSSEAAQYLDQITKDAKEGDEIVVDEASKSHLLDRWYSHYATLVIHVLKRGDDDDDGDLIKRGIDISLRCTITRTNQRCGYFGSGDRTTTTEHHVFDVRRYRNVFFESLIKSGFSPTKPTRSTHYNELIVYKEAQARIRYLVEVQLAKNK